MTVTDLIESLAEFPGHYEVLYFGEGQLVESIELDDAALFDGECVMPAVVLRDHGSMLDPYGAG